VNAESITIASSCYRDRADACSYNHRAQGDGEVSFVVMACVLLMAHRQLDKLSLAGFAANDTNRDEIITASTHPNLVSWHVNIPYGTAIRIKLGNAVTRWSTRVENSEKILFIQMDVGWHQSWFFNLVYLLLDSKPNN
jgi:hypothetical protein